MFSLSSFTLGNMFNCFGLFMDITGAYLLGRGFLGKTHHSLFQQSTTNWNWNSDVFVSLVDQKSSGMIGFFALLAGFIQQLISNIPYTPSIPDWLVFLILLVCNFAFFGFLIIYKRKLDFFYIGLFELQTNMGIPVNEITDPTMRKVRGIGEELVSIEKKYIITLLEKHAKTNKQLYRLIQCIGKNSSLRNKL
jgi:hypothetical protein